MNSTADAVSITTPADRQIRIERIFDAPRSQVWRAWTEPDAHRPVVGTGAQDDRGADGGEAGRALALRGGRQERHPGVRRPLPRSHPARAGSSGPSSGTACPGYVSVDTVELVDLGDGRTRLINTSLFFTDEERDGAMSSGMSEGVIDSYLALDRLLDSLKGQRSRVGAIERGQERLERVQVRGLDQVIVESRREGAAAIRLLSPAGERDERHVGRTPDRCRIRRATSMPSMPGMPMSSSTAVGL